MNETVHVMGFEGSLRRGSYNNVLVLGKPEVYITDAREKFDAVGRLVDERSRERIVQHHFSGFSRMNGRLTEERFMTDEPISVGFIETLRLRNITLVNLKNLKAIDVGRGVHYLQEDNPHLIGEELVQWCGG